MAFGFDSLSCHYSLFVALHHPYGEAMVQKTGLKVYRLFIIIILQYCATSQVKINKEGLTKQQECMSAYMVNQQLMLVEFKGSCFC